MQRNKASSWEKDFSDFLNIETAEVPRHLSQKIQDQIHESLHPTALHIFLRISVIQFFVGLFTLLFCPQFGVSFTSGMGIMPYLIKYGAGVCMFGCGISFTALGLLATSLLMSPEEVNALRKHQVLHLFSLAGLSLGVFICIGEPIIWTFGLLWILGAVFGGVISLELGWTLRKNLYLKGATL